MIQIEAVTKNFSRIYHTVDDIENFTIRVRLVDDRSQDEERVALFKWQQKRFSHQERVRYRHEENCLTDLEREYHRQIAKEDRRRAVEDGNRSMMFSYTSRDDLQTARRNDDDLQRRNELVQCLQRASLRHQTEEAAEEEEEEEERSETFDYFKSLRKSMKTPVLESLVEDASETFLVMADFGEEYDHTWIPAEYVLCTMRYHPKTKTLRISPDFTTFDAHVIKVTSDDTNTYRYFLENASMNITPETSKSNQEQLVLAQMSRSKRSDVHRETSPGGRYVHVILEILAGIDFENDHVFVRYSLHLNGWKTMKCDDEMEETTSGVTIASKRTRNRLHFGHPLEWHLLGDGGVKSDPVITFELIAKDTWSRFRSEGSTRLHLSWELPGRRVHALRCARITSPGMVNELRRFFVGDCANHRCREAGTKDINNMATCTTSTGVLEVAVNVLHVHGQAQSDTTCRNLREMRLRDKLRQPQLTKTVEEAVGAFRRARIAMLEARRAAVN